MKINQITPIRYGQSEINKPETDFLPEEEIVIPTKQSQSSTAKILLGAGILATTAAAGITIAKNKKIKKELETALKRVTDAESKIKDAEEKVKKEIKPESEIKPKTKTIVKYIEKDNTEKLIKKYNVNPGASSDMINYILAFDMLKAAPQNQRLMTSSVRQ